MFLLGLDFGSSSVKASLLEADSGTCITSAFYPHKEMEIIAHKPGWAEQDPETWIENLYLAVDQIKTNYPKELSEVKAIGITYQMHGLVAIAKDGKPVRDSIIWCDSRAVNIGEKAFTSLGEKYCLQTLLNSPGNFTASKLAWVKEFEPSLYQKISKIMLPGDYVAYRLTGEIQTTAPGLSEGIFWDYKSESISERVLGYFGFDTSIFPDIVPTFSHQGIILPEMAERMAISKNAVVAYRAGDQPNNAFSLKVLNPGEVAATGGTSGVIYGVSGKQNFDPRSRVNTFLHVNNMQSSPRLGILLCINSTGILNSWMKRELMPPDISYNEMNDLAAGIPPGSEGLMVYPFGNGAERILENKNPGASILGLNLNLHTKKHLLRAMQEGIVFSMIYGLEIMQEMGMTPKVIRAGKTNMFLSKVFNSTFANLSKARLELYNTDGSIGSARGAGLGVAYYKNIDEAFLNLKILETIEPEKNLLLEEAYFKWKNNIDY